MEKPYDWFYVHLLNIRSTFLSTIHLNWIVKPLLNDKLGVLAFSCSLTSCTVALWLFQHITNARGTVRHIHTH